MNHNPVSILISSYCGGLATQLCIESIFKKTDYPDFNIMVCDSSPADSEDRKYLKGLWEQKEIRLLESPRQLLHGEAIWYLIAGCETKWAVIMDCDMEIYEEDWLKYLFGFIKNDKDIGVAYYQPENVVPDRFWRTPRYLPFCMLINIDKYHEIAEDGDWLERFNIPWEDYPYKHLFQKWKGGHPYLKIPDNRVFGDTASRFAEKMEFEKPLGYKIQHLPWHPFFTQKVSHWGGVCIYHDQPEHLYVKNKLPIIKRHLEELRKP